MPLTSGQTFAGFTIVRLLGSGGMGEVYLAEHPRLPRRDALKILPTEVSANDEFRKRFEREADLASTLYHPYIVGVHDRGESDGQLWISMDYVDGSDTGELLRKRYPAGMPSQEVFEIVSAVAGALDYAHERGLLHRDVKPANILLTRSEQNAKRILLADFGIARRVDDISGLTATNMAVGTVNYAAPEQLMDTEVDGRADQYSLAATAFHLLTGVPPFDHSNPAVVISRHLNQHPPSLGDLRPQLVAHSDALTRGLAKDPAERFESCSAFAEALRDGGGGESPQRPEETAVALTRPSARTQRDHVNAAAGSASPTARDASPPARPTRPSNPLRAALYIGLTLVVIATVVLIVLILALPSGSPANDKAAPSSALSSPPNTAPAPAGASGAPACGDGPALLAGMSTRDKLAQLLMVGVKDAADARAVVSTQHVGGILITSSTDLSMFSDGSLSNIATAAGPLPLAVSVDEEGGRVSRLSKLIGPQPSPRELANTQTPDQVYNIALRRGQAMRKLGITIDFAPVADVSDEPDDAVIGDRSFGNDPSAVTDYAGAYARGLRDAGLLPVLKHFPGHGHGSGDSHTGSVTTPPIAELQNDDLVPYRTLTAAAPVAVMVGHLQVPGLTGSDPASLSPAAYALLRSGDYGGPPFNGPVFTDDLSNVQAGMGVAEAALRGLQAGADTALWVTTDEVPAVLDRLEKALAAGELAMPRVDASVLRMAAVKGPNPHCGR